MSTPSGKSQANSVAQLKKQYVLALTQFMAKLSLPEDALGRVKAKLHTNKENVIESLFNQLALELVKGPSASHLSDNAALPADNEDIKRALFSLCNCIVTTPENQQRLQNKKNALLKGIGLEQLPTFLRSLGELISDSLFAGQKEIHALEEFIEQLADQIRELEKFINSLRADIDSSRDNRETMEQSVETHFQDMQSEVEQANDLQELKLDIKERLLHIAGSMEEYRNLEESRLQTSEERNQEMCGQLQALEQETKNLQVQLEESRSALLIDPCTEVPSRFAYDEQIKLEYARWQRFQSSLTLLVWDIDHFKKINDAFGHQAGDRVLRMVAQLIYKRCRDSDFFARYGGEEFCMLLTNTDLKGATIFANDIREKVSHAGFNHQGTSVPITVSCGLAEFLENDTPESVFERADQALYQAKQDGRNLCIAA